MTRDPTEKRYLYKKLLFLDATSEALVVFIYVMIGLFFVILGSMMIRRVKLLNSRRYHNMSTSILQATLALTIALNFVALRYLLEYIFKIPLK